MYRENYGTFFLDKILSELHLTCFLPFSGKTLHFAIVQHFRNQAFIHSKTVL